MCDGLDELEEFPLVQMAQILPVISQRVKSVKTGVFLRFFAMKKTNQEEKERLGDGRLFLWIVKKRADDAFKEAMRQVVIE